MGSLDVAFCSLSNVRVESPKVPPVREKLGRRIWREHGETLGDIRMKAVQQTKALLKAARDALTLAIEAVEPDEIATLTATAGDAVARSIVEMESTFKGYRREVETRAKRLAMRGAE
jgi:hypothetical protein